MILHQKACVKIMCAKVSLIQGHQVEVNFKTLKKCMVLFFGGEGRQGGGEIVIITNLAYSD